MVFPSTQTPPLPTTNEERSGRLLGRDAPSGEHEVLEEGIVFAIEPAIYVHVFGGVRLEESLVVTSAGYGSLCPFPRRLGMNEEKSGNRV